MCAHLACFAPLPSAIQWHPLMMFCNICFLGPKSPDRVYTINYPSCPPAYFVAGAMCRPLLNYL